MPKLKKGDQIIDRETGEIETYDPVKTDAYLRSYGLRPVMLDDNGHEILDPTPMAPPVGFKPQPSMVEIVRQQIASDRLAQEAEELGLETFDEANDFDVDDDFDPSTPYEEMFDPPPPRRRFDTAEEQLNLRRDRPARPVPPAPDSAPAKPPEASVQKPSKVQTQVEPASPPSED